LGAPAHGIDAILFDMDGTLIDTEVHWHDAERWIAATHGTGWDATHSEDTVGASMDEGSRFLRDHCGVRLAHAEIQRLVSDYVSAQIRTGLSWKPGARVLLAEVRTEGLACALVTTSHRDVADALIKRLPAGAFDTVVTGDQVVHTKPDPEPYALASQRLGIPPARCLAIEDSLIGALSAQAAGCRVVVVPDRAPVQPADGRTVVETLEGLRLRDLVALVLAGHSGGHYPDVMARPGDSDRPLNGPEKSPGDDDVGTRSPTG
jgi:HAD superfamily hydrolase (TIGR01509 family)